jgi:hypothetical protein
MKPIGRALVLACTVGALMALPVGVSAQTNSEVHPGRYLLEIELPQSDGWEMSILAYDRHQVYLRAQRGFASVTYRAPGHVSSQRVEADFGTLGQIDLDLDLEARGTDVPRLHGRCTGRSPYELAGRLHGAVDFPGEPNVAGVTADRGKVRIFRSFQHVCRPLIQGKKKPLDLKLDLVGARSHENGRTTSFEAVGIDIESELLLGIVGASVYERTGEVAIARKTAGLAFEKNLRFSKPGAKPDRVWVKPTAPFSGRASYLKAAGEPPKWSGDLRVRVPGGGLLALAGPSFDATLCRPALDEIEGCKARLQELRAAAPNVLRNLYGSGSHSQPLAEARLSSLR